MSKNPLVGTPITDEKRLHDLILWDPEPRYSRTAIKLSNSSGNDVDYVLGQVVADANASMGDSVRGAQPAFTDAIVLANITIPDGASREVPAIVRGPALLNLDEVVRTSGSETDNQLITRLADLREQGIRFVREPGIQSTPDLSQ